MEIDKTQIVAGVTGTPREIIAMQAPVEIVAAAGEGDAKAGPPKFKIRAYNGGALTLNDWGYPVVIDIAGIKFANSITANLHHKTELIVGHVTEPTSDGKVVELAGLVSGTGAAAQEVLGNSANGYPWQASIEASPTQQPDFLGQGEKTSVNGRDVTGPVYVVRKSILYGIAFLPRGADDRTSVKIAASAAQKKGLTMDAGLKNFIAEMGGNPDSLSDEQLAKWTAMHAGHVAPQKHVPKKFDDVFAATRAEDERQTRIADICAQAVATRPYGDSEFTNRLELMAQTAVEKKMTPEAFELEVLRATKGPSRPIFAQQRGRDDGMSNDVLQAAICRSGGLGNIEKRFNEQTLEAVDKHFPRGIGLREIIIRAARANGYHGDGFDVTVEAQRYAFKQVGQPINAGFSTLSLPGILSNSAYKFLLEGWGLSDMECRKIASTRSVRDFKTVTSYRLGGNFKYLKIANGGEIKQGSVSEDTYTNQADTYGIRFALTRTDIINDDLSALTSIPKEMGFGAADSLNEVFWTEFLNNSAFFVAGNNNVSTGALSLASIAAAEAVFMAQTKPNGQPLAVTPKILLVPSAIKRTALTLMNSQLVIDGTATAAQGATNTFAGNFDVVSSPFLSNSLFTGYSSAAWYLLADPQRLSTVEIAFLNGQETPTIEEATADPNVLGIVMRGYHDFGVNLQEPRAGVRSTGA